MKGLSQIRDSGHKPKGLSFLPEYKIEALVVKDGKVISKKSWKAKTWVYNFLKMLFGQFYAQSANDTVTTLKATNGMDYDFPNLQLLGDPIGQVRCSSGNTNYGILIGTGASPSYSPDKYALDSQILETAMAHGECTVEYTTENQIRVSRTFVNNSGGELTVTEVALVMNFAGKYFMIAYDVPSGGISVPAGASLTLRYIISLS